MDADVLDRELDRLIASPATGAESGAGLEPELSAALRLRRAAAEPPHPSFAYTAFLARLGSSTRWRFPLRRVLVPGVIVLLVLAAPLWLVAHRLTAPSPELTAATVAVDRAQSTARQSAPAPAHTPRR